MHLLIDRYKAPQWPLLLATDDDGALRALEFADQESRMQRMLRNHYGDYSLQHGEAPRIACIRLKPSSASQPCPGLRLLQRDASSS